MKFSIIIPVYNTADYLIKCLESVLSQNYTDYECILINDGSTDNCPAICDDYSTHYPQIKVIHKQNSGLSDSRNIGIQAASGEYIIFLDSDDYFTEPQSLYNLYNIIQKTKSPVICNSNTAIFNNTTAVYFSCDGINQEIEYCSGAQFYKFYHGKALVAWIFCINRQFLIQHNLFFKKGIFHEDEHWIPRLICSVNTIAVNHHAFYTYRRDRTGSITYKITPKHLFDKIMIIQDFIYFVKNDNLLSYQRMIYLDYAVSLWISDLICSFSLDDTHEAKVIRNKLRRLSYIFLHQRKISDILSFLLFWSLGGKILLKYFALKKTIRSYFIREK